MIRLMYIHIYNVIYLYMYVCWSNPCATPAGVIVELNLTHSSLRDAVRPPTPSPRRGIESPCAGHSVAQAFAGIQRLVVRITATEKDNLMSLFGTQSSPAPHFSWLLSAPSRFQSRRKQPNMC